MVKQKITAYALHIFIFICLNQLFLSHVTNSFVPTFVCYLSLYVRFLPTFTAVNSSFAVVCNSCVNLGYFFGVLGLLESLLVTTRVPPLTSRLSTAFTVSVLCSFISCIHFSIGTRLVLSGVPVACTLRTVRSLLVVCSRIVATVRTAYASVCFTLLSCLRLQVECH